MDTLELDEQTVRDLEIFADTHQESGLFGALDQTRTELGRRALAEMLRNPPCRAEDIRRAQASLEFLRASGLLFPVDNAIMHRVNRYLESRIEVANWSSFTSKLRALLLAARFGANYRELQRGIDAVYQLISLLSAAVGRLLELGPDGAVANICHDADGIMREISTLCSSRSPSPGAWVVLRRDFKLRSMLAARCRRLLAIAAELDAMISLATVHFGDGSCLPEIVDGGSFLEMEGLKHPMIASAVGNNINLSAPNCTIYLTGPNMAGKTTLLKSVGIALILAQTGARVCAKSMKFTPFESLFVSINTHESLASGVSFYMAEILRLKEAARVLADGRRSLMLFDEMLKGTNVLDATEGTIAIVRACTKVRGSAFMFSSHLAAVASDSALPGVALLHFSALVRGKDIYFEHELQPGISSQRLGLRLIEREGIFDLLAFAACHPVNLHVE